MEKVKKTEENILSFLGANALINRCKYQDLFDESIKQEEIANIVAKNPEMSYKTLYEYHHRLNGKSKLILLQGCINNDEYLTVLVSSSIYDFKPTNLEYSFIISYLLKNDNYDLLSIMIHEKNIDLSDIKKFRIDKEVKEKWEGFLIIHKLTN